MNWLGLLSGYGYGYKNWTWIIIFILIIVFFYRRPFSYGYRGLAPLGRGFGLSPYYLTNFTRSNSFFIVLVVVLILVVGRWCC